MLLFLKTLRCVLSPYPFVCPIGLGYCDWKIRAPDTVFQFLVQERNNVLTSQIFLVNLAFMTCSYKLVLLFAEVLPALCKCHVGLYYHSVIFVSLVFQLVVNVLFSSSRTPIIIFYFLVSGHHDS